jgi:hypothetical protein
MEQLSEDHYRFLWTVRGTRVVRELAEAGLLEIHGSHSATVTSTGLAKLEEESARHATKRLWVSLMFFAAWAVGIIIFVCWRDWFLYANAHQNASDLLRTPWIAAWVCLGLAVRGYRYRKYPTAVGWQYLEYFGELLAGGFLLFGILHALGDATSGWLYYPISAPTMSVLALAPGKLHEWILGKVSGSSVV